MSHDRLIWAATIYLPARFTEDTTIGLYTDTSGNSYLSWSEASFTSDDGEYVWPQDFLSDMMVDGAFGKIAQDADFRRGGAPAQVGGTELRILNTGRVAQKLTDYGISLPGCKAQIIEITVGADGVETGRDVIFTGIVGVPVWNEIELTIPMDNPSSKRKAQILTIDPNNVIIPAVFGRIDKAKFIRTDNDRNVITNEDFTDGGIMTPQGGTVFPVVSVQTTPTRTYTIAATTSPYQFIYVKPDSELQALCIGAYLLVVEGKSAGKFRQITNITTNSASSELYLDVTVKSFFEDTLVGSTDASATDQCWVKIVSADYVYECDRFQIKGLLGSDGLLTTERPELFTYEGQSSVKVDALDTTNIVKSVNDEYYRIPDYTCNTNIVGNGNKLEIEPEHFDTDFNTVESYDIIPVDPDEITLATETNVVALHETISGHSTSYDYLADGLYEASYPRLAHFDIVDNTGGDHTWDDAADRISTSYGAIDYSVATPAATRYYFAHVIHVMLPDIPEGTNFSSCFLHLRLRQHGLDETYGGSCTQALYQDMGLCVYKERMIGAKTTIIEDLYAHTSGTGGDIYKFDNTLEEFYKDEITTGFNRDFYVNENSPTFFTAGGIARINLNISSYEEYKNNRRVTIVTRYMVDGAAGASSSRTLSRYYEIGVAIKKTNSIQNHVFSGVDGRIWADSAGLVAPGFHTGTDMISNMVDVLEHALMLQNWSDNEDTTTDFGHSYSGSATIRITNEGGFYDSGIVAVGGTDITLWNPGDILASREILNESDGWTDEIIKSICSDTFTCHFQDEDGYECIKFLNRLEAPATTIDLDDIVGNIGEIQMPDPYSDIFVQPLIKYDFDYGAGEYKESLAVNHVNAASWVAAYTPGIDGTGNLRTGTADGQVIWELCAALWAKYRCVNSMPTDLSEKKWYSTYEDALWYLYNLLTWCGKPRVSMSVLYSVGKAFFVSQHININLPHQTAGRDVECVIEGIEKDKNRGTVTLKLIILGEISLMEILQDTTAAGADVLQDQTTGTVEAIYQNSTGV
jgi:hypothetical protein